MDDFELELKVSFLDEALQSATEVESCFLELETKPDDDENINRIFRHVHNLKGSSRAVGFEEFANFTHQFESFILKVKNKEMKATSGVISLLLKGNDQVLNMINGLKADINSKFEFAGLLASLKNYSESSIESASISAFEEEALQATEEENQILADVNSEESLAHSVIESSNEVRQDLSIEDLLALHEKSQIEIPTKAAALAPTPVATTQAKETLSPSNVSANKAVQEETIRVSLDKIETLMNSIGEMVILQGVLRESVADSASPNLKKTVHQSGKVGKEIQDIAMSLRMIPIKPTFQKMQRIVRDTSKELDKNIQFDIFGEDTEVDKTVVEKINDPLVHLIRNAVDHGIENSEKRIASGKNPQGIVKLSAVNQAGKLIIEIKDDGGGIDPVRLKNKAIEKGLIKANNTLSDKDALQLIFAPGFSTKEKVTDTSGRGVGMDVVKTNITALSGEIIIDSVIGSGTTFKVILPLTLAIIDAMIVTYSTNKFVLPLSQVLETVSPSPEMIQKNTDLGEVLMLRGENLPLIRLGDLFGMKNQNESSDMIAIVLSIGQKSIALLVDDILGRNQVVIKQLSPELQAIKGLSGTTILGDGKPALILDPNELVRRKVISGYVAPATQPALTTIKSNLNKNEKGSAA